MNSIQLSEIDQSDIEAKIALIVRDVIGKIEALKYNELGKSYAYARMASALLDETHCELVAITQQLNAVAESNKLS